MAFVNADRVKETSTTTGTGTYSLAGAATGFRTFVAGIGSTNTCHYVATDGTAWEVGIGTVTDGTPDTLARTAVLASSNAGAAVSWAAGTRDVFCAPLAAGFTTAAWALLDDADAAAMRTTLGLGTAATSASGAFATASHTHAQSDVTGLVAALAAATSDLAYVAAGADVAINNVADRTIVTRDVTGVGATDILDVTADFVILNNSTAARVYQITLDFDGLFDVEFTTGSLAFSTTLMHPFTVRGVLSIRSTSLAYATFVCEGQLAAGIAAGTDTTMAATHLRAMGWGTTASDASGTTTVALKIRSANATATQTCRLLNFQIRKATPT